MTCTQRYNVDTKANVKCRDLFFGLGVFPRIVLCTLSQLTTDKLPSSPEAKYSLRLFPKALFQKQYPKIACVQSSRNVHRCTVP